MDRDLSPLRYREHPTLAWRISSVVLIGCLILIFILGMWRLIFETRAYAHEAPTGWRFDLSCCSNRDCGQVPADWIVEGADGVTVVPTGEKLSYGDTRIKDSPDGLTYWCRPPGASNPHTICVYLPPKSF